MPSLKIKQDGVELWVCFDKKIGNNGVKKF